MRELLVSMGMVFCLLSPGNAQDAAPQTKKEKISSIREAAKHDSQGMAFLSKYLNDPNVDVRDEAVKAMVSIGTQYSLDPLIKSTHDNDAGIQIRAVDGLVNFYLPGYVTTGGVTKTFTRVSKKIKTTLDTRNDDVIGSAVVVRADVVDAIAGVIDGGSSLESRANAARAAGILRGKTALPQLEKALQSKDSSLILESLIAIQKIGDTSTGPSATFLANDPNTDVQTTALETLGILHVSDAGPSLRQLVSRPKNDKVRRSALEALSMLAFSEDRNLFLQYKDSKDPDLRMSALEGLGRIRDPQDYPTIESAFANERESKPRLAAAFSLVNEGKVELSTYSPLQYLVNGLNLSKAESTSGAYLQELSRRAEVRKALLPALRQGSKAEKLGLIRALAPNADEETSAAIQELTHDPDAEVSIAAARNQTTKAR
jgi:HEAT repeat protein